MKKSWLVVFSLIVAVALLGTTGCISEEDSASTANVSSAVLPSGETLVLSNSSQQSGIWVNGQGKVSVEPDLAILNLGIEAQSATIAEARAQAAAAMERVMTVLQDGGIEEKDIQTSRFSIYPVRKWDRETEEEKQIGFRVSNMVNIKVRDLEKAGPIIDSVAEAGGDLTRIQGISFTVEDPTPYYDQAREKAVAAGKAKAQQLADLANVTLGKVTYITESSGGYYPVPMAGAGAMMAEKSFDAGTSISPGEQEISVSVQIGFGIE